MHECGCVFFSALDTTLSEAEGPKAAIGTTAIEPHRQCKGGAQRGDNRPKREIYFFNLYHFMVYSSSSSKYISTSGRRVKMAIPRWSEPAQSRTRIKIHIAYLYPGPREWWTSRGFIVTVREAPNRVGSVLPTSAFFFIFFAAERHIFRLVDMFVGSCSVPKEKNLMTRRTHASASARTSFRLIIYMLFKRYKHISFPFFIIYRFSIFIKQPFYL